MPDLDEALPIAPVRHQNLFFRAAAHEALGEREQARDDLREALRLVPDFPEAREMLEALAALAPGSLPGGGR